MASAWQIYDELIECVPEDVRAQECLVGLHWTLVRAGGVGVAMTPTHERFDAVTDAGALAGMPLRWLAGRVKSWNQLDAALGLAAINAAVNAPSGIARSYAAPVQTSPGRNVFEAMAAQLRGCRVAVIGHFRGLEPLAEVCELTILERCPQPGDLPDTACEYVLGSQDYIFITATTLINKTLPRLLELGRHARVVLTGPSTPLSPLLFAHGVDVLAGQIVRDADAVFRRIREGGRHDFTGGETQMLIFTSNDVRDNEVTPPQ